MHSRLLLLLGLALPLLGCSGSSGSPGESGCQKDSDCKGDRVCVAGACEAPSAAGGTGCWVHEDCGAGSCEETGQCRPLSEKDTSIWFGGVTAGIAVLSEPRQDAQRVGSLAPGGMVSVLRATEDNAWRLVHWKNGEQRMGGWASASGIEDQTVNFGGGTPPPAQPRPPRVARPAAPSRPRATPVSDPPGGCKLDGVIYEANGSVWGCEGGGNWCANSGPLTGGCAGRR